jgi:hypothetical protein
MTKPKKTSAKRVKAIEKSTPSRKVKHPDRTFMTEAINVMLQSRSEGAGKTDPLVGAVLVSGNGTILGRAYRGTGVNIVPEIMVNSPYWRSQESRYPRMPSYTSRWNRVRKGAKARFPVLTE